MQESWLRGLDSNQDNQLQRLAGYQLHHPGMGKKSVADLASICYSTSPNILSTRISKVCWLRCFQFANGGKFLKKCFLAGPGEISPAELSRFFPPYAHPTARELALHAARRSEHALPPQESSLDPCRRFHSSLARQSPDAPYFPAASGTERPKSCSPPEFLPNR